MWMLSRTLCHGQLSYAVALRGSHLDGLFSSFLNCNGRDSVTAPQTNGTYRGLSPARHICLFIGLLVSVFFAAENKGL